MSAILTPLSPQETRRRLSNRSAVLVDIREPDEFARRHISGAISQPLSGWEAAELSIDPDHDVIFACRSGMRTAGLRAPCSPRPRIRLCIAGWRRCLGQGGIAAHRGCQGPAGNHAPGPDRCRPAHYDRGHSRFPCGAGLVRTGRLRRRWANFCGSNRLLRHGAASHACSVESPRGRCLRASWNPSFLQPLAVFS